MNNDEKYFNDGYDKTTGIKMKPKIGDRKVMVCGITKKPVEMEYTGEDEAPNGHKGWLCLHTSKEDMNISRQELIKRGLVE